jgi:GT2 family glycosyltransferase
MNSGGLRLSKVDRLRPTVDLSVIIVNYNTYELLEQLLNSINEAVTEVPVISCEVILIDNSIIKRKIAVTKFSNINLRVVKTPRNIGFTRGVNLGIYIARGRHVLITTPDVFIPKEMFIKIIQKFILNKEKLENSIVGFKIINKRTNEVDSIGGTLSFYTGASIIFKKTYRKYVLYPGGAAVLANRSLLRKLGYYDSFFFAYGDEVDLGLRAWLMGIKVVIEPGIIFFHSPTSSFSFKKSLLILRQYLIIRNHLLIMLKYFSIKAITFNMFFSLIYILKIKFKKDNYTNSNKLSFNEIFSHIIFAISELMKIAPHILKIRLYYKVNSILSFDVIRNKLFEKRFYEE